MSDSILDGFDKRAGFADGLLGGMLGIQGALGGMAIGSGIGYMSRARLEEKFKEKKDLTLADKLVSKAPMIGAITGVLAGGAYGYNRGSNMVRNLVDDAFSKVVDTGVLETGEKIVKGFMKKAALRPEVALKQHQQRALQRLDDPANKNSLLAAHATGTGKTLTSIAAFEKLKADGKAKRAIVVVPASLRENFVNNGVKKFTNSSVNMFGPKAESKSLNVGDASNADYNVISYELFRDHGDKILETTGADTLIMDEVHKVRDDQSSIYSALREMRPKFKQAITLTGSVVNNEPADVVPLLDITFGPDSHKFVNKKFFDKLFVQKDAKKQGILFPKVHIEKNIKNKKQLGGYLGNFIDYVSHEEVADDLPAKNLENVEVPMTAHQKKLYDFTLASVDPITRWKIRNNFPVTQKEAKDAFTKLLQARQVSTDPAVLDKTLKDKNPMTYSPKVKKVVDDLREHLEQSPQNRTVIYGNLIQGQLDTVERALKAEGVDYTKFVGTGQEGVTHKSRSQAIDDFNANKKRVLLLSGAGAEGLDLKNATMMQMLEGHYNPEKILQAESRVRRLGAFADRPKEERKVTIKRYFSKPEATGVKKMVTGLYKTFGMTAGDPGVDKWVYTIANRKDALNKQFRDVVSEKKAGDFTDGMVDAITESPLVAHGFDNMARSVGSGIFGIPGRFVARKAEATLDKDIEATLKQKLLDLNMEELTTKKHYDKILAESKLDERVLDATHGFDKVLSGAATLAGLGVYGSLLAQASGKKLKDGASGIISSGVKKILPRAMKDNALARFLVPGILTGAVLGNAMPYGKYWLKKKVLTGAIGGNNDLEIGITRYTDKQRKKMERKYKSSKGFVNEYETKKELGIDTIA